MQHLSVLGYDQSLRHVIAEATPKTIQALELRYRGPVHPWAPFEPPGAIPARCMGEAALVAWVLSVALVR